MPSDSEVRDVVRQFMRRFDSMNARFARFLHVVARTRRNTPDCWTPLKESKNSKGDQGPCHRRHPASPSIRVVG